MEMRMTKWKLGLHEGLYMYIHMGGCQNYGPFLGPYYSTAPNT